MMYKMDTGCKFEFKVNRQKTRKPREEPTYEDLMYTLKAAKFYNHKIIEINRQNLVNEYILEEPDKTYKQYKNKLGIPQEIQENNRQMDFYGKILESLAYIEKLPTEEYLLIINYLFNDKSIDELMESADVTTRQGLYKKVKSLVRKGFQLYSKDFFKE